MRDALSQAEPLAAVKIVRERVDAFAADAHVILQRHEAAARSRVITIEQTRRKLQGLSVRQDKLLEEALDCIEYGLFRSAHVSAWQAFIDFLEEKLESDGLVKIHAARPGWVKWKTMDDIRDEVAESQIIDAAHAVKLISKGERKSLQGLLSTRNACAHPGSYHPGVNESLGYVSELINRMAQLQPKSL
jgi:hypothetical protein